MITIRSGNLLQADVEALVNTVNCVGHMGKGIALQFKKAFPANFVAYRKACRAGEVRPGGMFVFETAALVGPRYIINFPTKRHWRGTSRMEDIESGLAALARIIGELGIASIAVPPLGCGLGGLMWDEVRPRIEHHLGGLPGLTVQLFEPGTTPDARDMPVRTRRPRMTVARALLLRLMEQYVQLAYRLTLLEVQKLAYFLQEAGEPLRLRFEKGHYGPYAHNLNKVLEILEGHFIRGYGDTQKPDVEIGLLPGAVDAAQDFLKGHPESLDRLERVAALIEGFETPYGMELLSSVHWVCTNTPPPPITAAAVSEAVQAWSERERSMFRPEHIEVAWERLVETGWVAQEQGDERQVEPSSVALPGLERFPQKFHADIRRAVEILKEGGCTEVRVFGSVAEGRVREGSDLDLAVRGCPPEQFFPLLGRLLAELEHSVDLIDLDRDARIAGFLSKHRLAVHVG